MTQFVFANNVSTTLAAATSNTANTFTLSSSANLPTLLPGQIMPLTLNDAATRTVFEIVYVTAIDGTTLTVERAQEGTSAQNWNVGDYAYCAFTAGTTAPVVSTHSPSASETLPVANRLVVTPGTLTAAIDLTLNDQAAAGSSVDVFGSASAYEVTVQSPVTTGSPYIELPDGSQVYSWTIPASSPYQGIHADWDGTNWRCTTVGQTVVAPATSSNEAVTLGQLQNGTESLDITGLTATSARINGNAVITGTATVSGATSSGQAVNLSQVASVAPVYSYNVLTLASGKTYTRTVSFTAPSNGFIVGIATQNNSADPQPASITQTLSINGRNYGHDSTIISKSNYGVASVSAGTACTVTNTIVVGTSTGSFETLSQTVVAIFIPNP